MGPHLERVIHGLPWGRSRNPRNILSPPICTYIDRWMVIWKRKRGCGNDETFLFFCQHGARPIFFLSLSFPPNSLLMLTLRKPDLKNHVLTNHGSEGNRFRLSRTTMPCRGTCAHNLYLTPRLSPKILRGSAYIYYPYMHVGMYNMQAWKPIFSIMEISGVYSFIHACMCMRVMCKYIHIDPKWNKLLGNKMSPQAKGLPRSRDEEFVDFAWIQLHSHLGLEHLICHGIGMLKKRVLIHGTYKHLSF